MKQLFLHVVYVYLIFVVLDGPTGTRMTESLFGSGIIKGYILLVNRAYGLMHCKNCMSLTRSIFAVFITIRTFTKFIYK